MFLMNSTFIVILLVLISSCKKRENIPIELIGWGDSMMKGVGGLESNSIAVLQGGLPLELVFDKKNIRIWGKVTTTHYNILPFNYLTKKYRKGHINNTRGRLIRNEDASNPKETESFTFRKNISLESLELEDTLIFNFDNAIVKNKTLTIIWAGRNDKKSGDFMYQTKDNIQAMIDHLDKPSKEHLLILSVCNGIADKEFKGSNAHTNIMRLNKVLKSAFEEYFVDVRTYMVNDAIYDMEIEPTSQDIEDMKKDCIPRSFLNDHVHFNTLGYEATGKFLAKVIRKKGWID